MTEGEFVDIQLRVFPSGVGITGTVGRADLQPEPFAGWLELTAVVARILSRSGVSAGDAVQVLP
jgi:hypothetical protein